MDLRFTIDAQGNLSPDEREAKLALGARAGQYFLTPATKDLLVFVRSPPSGEKVSPPRLVMAGDAGAFPLPDLIAFLSQARWTGVVRIHAPSGTRGILLKDGEVRGASSDDPADRIGEVMLRLGLITRAQLDEVLRELPPSKIGRALVERGIVQPHDLWRGLTEQVSEVFQAIILCREGAFVLLEQSFDERQLHNLNLSMQSLLMDSIRKIDEMAHFRKRIPHGRVTVAKKRSSDGNLEQDEDAVLALVNGARTVTELGQAARLSEFEVTRVVYRLIEGGYVQIAEGATAASAARASTPAAAQRSAPRARGPRDIIKVFNDIFRIVRDEVAEQRMEREFIATVNAALAGKALSPSPVLEGMHLGMDGTLDEEALLARFEAVRGKLGSEPVASLRQALSDVMFFLLFQAGELLEARADEELSIKVKALVNSLDEG